MTSRLKKICVLTSVHPAVEVRIFYKECKTLASAGYQVILIGQHDTSEIKDGVTIIPIRKPKNRLVRMLWLPWKMLFLAIKQKADVYHFHDPELISLGILLKVTGHKVIYDAHEDVPRDILSKQWIPYVFRQSAAWIMSLVEWIGAQTFDAIVPATPKIAARFPLNKTCVVQNFPIGTELVAPNTLPYMQRAFSFAYVGGIESIRGAIEMISAFEGLHDIPGARLELAGEFSPSSLEYELRAHPGWASVHYHGQVSREQVAHLLGSVRAGLVTLHPTAAYLDSYPIKMFEYMSAGLPVIASDFPLWRQIIEGANCGLLVNPLDSKAIAEAMQWIIDHPEEAETMGQNGKAAVRLKYNWEAESRKLLDLYDYLIGGKCAA